jgi:hypothetical protein
MFPIMTFQGIFTCLKVFKGYNFEKAKGWGMCEARVEEHAAVVPPSAVT